MSPLPPQPLSPLDGRYRSAVEGLGEHLSEAGLNRARVHVEVEWLLFLADRGMFGATAPAPEKAAALREWAAGFGQDEIDELARTEAVTRHGGIPPYVETQGHVARVQAVYARLKGTS